jgi:hypothetical protein
MASCCSRAYSRPKSRSMSPSRSFTEVGAHARSSKWLFWRKRPSGSSLHRSSKSTRIQAAAVKVPDQRSQTGTTG